MKKTGLGRGLGSLLPAADQPMETSGGVSQVPGDRVLELPIGQIDPNREQPRKKFDHDALEQLSQSIAASGVLQPILVFPKEGRYQIIAGERRWRAARIAGLKTIPAIVRDWDKVKQMEASLVENIQREDLNAIEEAAAIRNLMDECGLTQEAVANRLGRSRPAVANLLRLLSLSKEIQDAVISGELSAGHARVLAGIDDPERQKALFQAAITQGWSVRQLEQAASKKDVPQKKVIPQPIEIAQMQERLLEVLGMKANIQGNREKGRIVLTYHSEEALERLYELIERE